MKYRVVSLNVNHNANYDQFSTISGISVNMPGQQTITADVTIEIDEVSENNLRSIEDFEVALSGVAKIHEDAPSYHELLAKHAPEFLL